MGIFAFLFIGGAIYVSLNSIVGSEVFEAMAVVALIMLPFVALTAMGIALIGVVIQPNMLSVLTICACICIGLPLLHIRMSQVIENHPNSNASIVIFICQIVIFLFGICATIIFATEPFATMFPDATAQQLSHADSIDSAKSVIAYFGAAIGVVALIIWIMVFKATKSDN